MYCKFKVMQVIFYILLTYGDITKGLKNKISNFDNVQNLEFSFFQPSKKLHQ